jgi:membrane protein implicated in regulation of membrane protease activity
VLTLIAIVLAIFILPGPWGLLAVLAGATLDISETLVFRWWSRRPRPRVGVETLLGQIAVAVGPLSPGGQVRIGGELWNARCDGWCESGGTVVVRAVEGLTLVVEKV